MVNSQHEINMLIEQMHNKINSLDTSKLDIILQKQTEILTYLTENLPVKLKEKLSKNKNETLENITNINK